MANYFETHGVHTRLYYVIRRAGGIDKETRRNWLRKEFNLDEETLDVVLMYDVENLSKRHGNKDLKQLVLDYEKRKKDNAEKARQRFMASVNRLCMISNMLNPGDIFR